MCGLGLIRKLFDTKFIHSKKVAMFKWKQFNIMRRNTAAIRFEQENLSRNRKILEDEWNICNSTTIELKVKNDVSNLFRVLLKWREATITKKLQKALIDAENRQLELNKTLQSVKDHVTKCREAQRKAILQERLSNELVAQRIEFLRGKVVSLLP